MNKKYNTVKNNNRIASTCIQFSPVLKYVLEEAPLTH